jgi:hypothetical protein
MLRLTDADAPPLAEADLGRMPKLVNLKKLRERLGQTQEAAAVIPPFPESRSSRNPK